MQSKKTTQSNPRTAIPWFEELVATSDHRTPERTERYEIALDKLASLGWFVMRSSRETGKSL